MNKLYFGDCLEFLKQGTIPNNSIDLVYIDPPFNSKRNYNILYKEADLTDDNAQKEAFKDTWSDVAYKDTLELIKDIDLDLYSFLNSLDNIRISKSAVSYLTTMAIRIWYIHKVLKDTGSFYLHCDPKMSHYLKLICDIIFGEKNFNNEIIWSYQRWTNNVGAFISTHDDILFYCKNYKEHYFKQQKEPFSIKSKHEASRITYIIDGKLEQEYTDDKSREKAMRDVWEISYLNSQANERLGYPTQKPEALLERIIKASSKEGDLIADFFCGCGTTIAVAQKLKRNWIGVDISHLAIGLIERKRLIEPYINAKIKPIYEIHGFPKDINSAKELAENVKGGRFEFQNWIIESKLGGICNPKKTADGGWDGHLNFNIQIGEKKEKNLVLIEVKSGNVNVKNLREFIHVVQNKIASIGVLVCFKEHVTKPMLLEAKNAGYYRKDLFGTMYDKIQILTVEDILENKGIIMPRSTETTFKSAQAYKTIDGVSEKIEFYSTEM